MSYASIARLTCSRTCQEKHSAQNAALCRRISTTAGALQRRHFIRFGTAADHRADLDHVGLADPVLAREQLALADHEHGIGVDVELAEDVVDLPAAGELDLPVRLRSLTFTQVRLAHPPGQGPQPRIRRSGPGSRPA